MIKDVIGRIIEAEARAERIEAEAAARAEAVLNDAMLESSRLRSCPSEKARAEAEFIISNAEARARELAAEKPLNAFSSISPALIDEAVEVIVDAFLKRDL